MGTDCDRRSVSDVTAHPMFVPCLLEYRPFFWSGCCRRVPRGRRRRDVTARPHVISFSNGCTLIPQPEALENVSRVIIHYLNMK